MRGGKLGSGCPKSSSVEFVAKFMAKSFALSAEEVITSGPLMMVGMEVFPMFRTMFVIKKTHEI